MPSDGPGRHVKELTKDVYVTVGWTPRCDVQFKRAICPPVDSHGHLDLLDKAANLFVYDAVTQPWREIASLTSARCMQATG